MGFAIVWVLIYHFGLLTPGFREIASVGFGGVDIFMFVSGFGLYFSLKKSEGRDVKGFLKRRISKLMPAYVIVGFALSLFIFHDSIPQYFLRVSTIGFWIGGVQYEWFVPSIVFCYLAFPVVFYALERKRKLFLMGWIFSMLAPLPFIVFDKCGIWQYHLLYRLPIFIFGAYTAQMMKKECTMKRSSLFLRLALVCLVVGVVLMLLENPHFTQYGLTFLCPIIIVCLCLICKIMQILGGVGKHTLEIYLCHLMLFKPLKSGLLTVPNEEMYNVLLVIMSIAMGTLFAYVYKKLKS